ncbi:LysR family transcriptional regulator [Luteimicrobium sp. DT211]|uniref:LysR family transcriptional regulator n=1 Tax=Luteimicrobium sp. DT211 TaxID=3393412 RepID=UPI003CF59F1A
MDLDLRKLRYFVTVADALHFGRAAEELHIAQPALSRQIRALEDDLGAPLFIRDSHGVVLTDAGRQLLDDAGPLLASARAVRRRVSVAARGGRRLVVGFRAGIPVIPAARAFGARHPDVVVDVQRTEWDDQAQTVLDGRVDVGFVRLPVDETGLRLVPLFTEPLLVALPTSHPLAGKEEISESDLAGERLIWHGDASTRPTRLPYPDSGLRAHGVDEKLEHVAAGRGITFVASSESLFYSRPDISYVPVRELAPDQVGVAMAASRPSRLADDFFAAAQATADVTAECGSYEMWRLASSVAAGG